MSKASRIKTCIFKIESTYGVEAASMDMATGGMEIYDLKIQPMKGRDAVRKRERQFFSAPERLSTGEYVEVTGAIELVGHATRGTVPKWSPIMRCCGMQEAASAGVSVTYNPVSTGFASGSMHVNIDGIRQAILGCRGTGRVRFDAHELPKFEFTMTGLFAGPTDTAILTGVPSAFNTAQVVNDTNTPTFTVNGVTMAMQSFLLDFGNKVTYRELVNSSEVLITDAEPDIQTRVEATTMAAFNPFTIARNATAFAVNLVHGTTNSKIVTVNAPSCRLRRPEDYAESDMVLEWNLGITPMPVSGSDDYTIVLT